MCRSALVVCECDGSFGLVWAMHVAQTCYCVTYLWLECFPQELLGLAPMQIHWCRLITQPGDQWAHPGIVLQTVFDGVSLQAPSCGQNDTRTTRCLDITC